MSFAQLMGFLRRFWPYLVFIVLAVNSFMHFSFAHNFDVTYTEASTNLGGEPWIYTPTFIADYGGNFGTPTSHTGLMVNSQASSSTFLFSCSDVECGSYLKSSLNPKYSVISLSVTGGITAQTQGAGDGTNGLKILFDGQNLVSLSVQASCSGGGCQPVADAKAFTKNYKFVKASPGWDVYENDALLTTTNKENPEVKFAFSSVNQAGSIDHSKGETTLTLIPSYSQSSISETGSMEAAAKGAKRTVQGWFSRLVLWIKGLWGG
jgi:hypothetical protein